LSAGDGFAKLETEAARRHKNPKHTPRQNSLMLPSLVAAAVVAAAAVVLPRALPPSPRASIAMELRMPADLTTVDQLIQRTKDNLQEGLVVVLHFDDPYAAPNTWDYSYAATSETSSERLLEISNEFSVSEERGGRPVIFLQIDRTMAGMDVICSKRGVNAFPTLQVWSRGQGEDVKVGELTQTLLALGAASRSTAARAEGGYGRPAGTAPVDMFGVGSGGARLTQEGIRSAMRKAPQQGGGRGGGGARQSVPGGEEEEEAELAPPASAAALEGEPAADDVDAQLAALEAQIRGVRRESQLDALFAEPNWDDDDLPPPI